MRQLAQHWGLEVWDKPATPCLSSRVVYGLDITPERLLRKLGFDDVRVRYHHDDLARLQVTIADLPRLSEENTRTAITSQLRELGFRYVTIDLEGFCSGGFQQLVPVETLEASTSGNCHGL